MFDEANCEFEVCGYFEEFLDAQTFRCYGTRRIEGKPDRELGYAGRREQVLTEDLHLNRGPRAVVVRASKAKPLHVMSMLQAVCGRKKGD